MTILLALLGLISALTIPAVSQSEISQSQLLAQRGKEFYETGNLEQAIASWEQAAQVNGQNGDNVQRTANLINKSTAQQALGLYGESCATVLEAFEIEETNCFELLDAAQPLEQRLQGAESGTSFPQADSSFAYLQALVAEPQNLSQATGLLRLGDYFTNNNYPQVARSLVDQSLQIAQALDNPRQETAAFLSLGNTVRAIAQKEQNQFPPQTVALDNIVNRNGSATVALNPYQPAINYYEEAANSAQSNLNSLKAKMNHLSMLLDIEEFWQMAITDLTENLDVIGIRDRNFQNRIDNGTLNLQSGLNRELQPQISRLTTDIRRNLNSLPVSRSGVFARINFAQSLIRQDILDANTATILASAIEFAQQLNNPIAEAEATGYLGYLYEQEQKYPEARQLTEKALELAPTIQSPEIAYRWHAQLGRILAKQDNREAA
ncbi:MAG: tetratricopeptide repeat protein, partial [Xenococcus sp. (in: cyanobacteria)]